jgi:hypothetical protein
MTIALMAAPVSLTMKRISKWRILGERLVKLKDGESIVLESECDLAEEARKIRHGLNGIKTYVLIRRTVKVVDRKIVITRVGTWQKRGGF